MQIAPSEQQEESTQHLTIAQSIKRSSDPYRAAVASFTRREVGDGFKRFFFEDRSVLNFKVTHTATEEGMES
ncbi:hypothetical protein N5D52_28985 [Pseudomonas sp. GD03860]|uniref:hypothetical protein n=1 Tax=Pseudomonas sp. GD03860 TaxID=2975389 RepID=UPI002448F43A|nr:hypothetical protein [Pseudomonas sp. GD03860]MDH0640964.1 hypothetical protein [Pseudomonas sp. GD03860]